jgi:hypothetical protein
MNASKNNLNVDFNHRLAALHNGEPECLTDSIGLMTDRALGILYLLSGQFEDDDSRLCDALLCGAIDAAIHEVEDIKELVKAYNLAESAKRKA